MRPSMTGWPSSDDVATKLNAYTSRDWPMRWMRPNRCSRRVGFQGRS